ncbi:hypothetical protein GUJ93_ZPchr0006g43741 [Zizania palustris]|uniref:Uncharacterized protein n=1 Tax=Zizania palustris TaxID=103762 RepID=A0A8J5T537_ZIZPA|nr:hypothetical protein GUJ93_ZPchr0006g43741 [Zizania palustris]
MLKHAKFSTVITADCDANPSCACINGWTMLLNNQNETLKKGLGSGRGMQPQCSAQHGYASYYSFCRYNSLHRN